MALAIYSLLGVAQVPTYVPTDGLVGYWPFNGNANDESGNGNDGTVNGATLTQDRNGNIDAAYSFDGNQYIDISSTNGINTTNGISMSIWFNWAGPNSWSGQYLYQISPNPNGAVTLDNNGNLSVNVLNCNCSEDVAISTVISQNSWFHVVLTYDLVSGLMKMYLDGVLIGTSQESIFSYYTTNNPGDRFGCYHFNEYFFSGKLDDGGLWNRVLTEEEILALYNGCNVLPTAIAGNLSPITLTSADYACNNNPGSTYQWTASNGVVTAGQGTSNVTILWGSEGAGTLTVVETNAEGCTGAPTTINVDVVCATTASTIDGPLGPNALTETTYTCNGVDGSTYQWTISNGVITSGQGTNSVTVLWAGTGLGSISVQETTNANCTGDVISIDVVVIPTSINEVEENAMILYYPNPTSNSLTMEFGNNILSFGYSVRILNSIGQTIHSTNVTSSAQVIDVNTWSSGTYFISVLDETGTEVQTKTVIIQ